MGRHCSGVAPTPFGENLASYTIVKIVYSLDEGEFPRPFEEVHLQKLLSGGLAKSGVCKAKEVGL